MSSFSATVTITDITKGPFSLFSLLNSVTASTGLTLGTGAVITPAGAKPISYVSIQNVSGGTLYLGDSTLTGSTNVGISLPNGGVIQINPARGGAAWANLIYFNSSANTTVINITAIYGT